MSQTQSKGEKLIKPSIWVDSKDITIFNTNQRFRINNTIIFKKMFKLFFLFEYASKKGNYNDTIIIIIIIIIFFFF